MNKKVVLVVVFIFASTAIAVFWKDIVKFFKKEKNDKNTNNNQGNIPNNNQNPPQVVGQGGGQNTQGGAGGNSQNQTGQTGQNGQTAGEMSNYDALPADKKQQVDYAVTLAYNVYHKGTSKYAVKDDERALLDAALIADLQTLKAFREKYLKTYAVEFKKHATDADNYFWKESNYPDDLKIVLDKMYS